MVSFLSASAEAIPLETGSVDTVVTMGSIPDARAALAEMLRVLKPGGELLFVEHGRGPNRWVVHLQDWLIPAWRSFAGGCHLNRPIADLIAAAGFRMQDPRIGYAPGPKPFTFLYEGRTKGACPRASPRQVVRHIEGKVSTPLVRHLHGPTAGGRHDRTHESQVGNGTGYGIGRSRTLLPLDDAS